MKSFWTAMSLAAAVSVWSIDDIMLLRFALCILLLDCAISEFKARAA